MTTLKHNFREKLKMDKAIQEPLYRIVAHNKYKESHQDCEFYYVTLLELALSIATRMAIKYKIKMWTGEVNRIREEKTILDSQNWVASSDDHVGATSCIAIWIEKVHVDTEIPQSLLFE